jgi:hypothetical protein
MISNLFSTSRLGIQRADSGLQRTAVELARSTARIDKIPARDVHRSLTELKQHQQQSAANVRVLKTADEMLGNLLDVNA